MKKIILVVALFIGTATFAQDVEINSKNSWLKLGLNAGLPVGDAADASSFAVGLDLRGQYLVTEHFGIGVTSGYNHFFGKDGLDDFGLVPLAAFGRYYFQTEGVFLGADLGYGFLTNIDNNSGGLYVNPQVGYHNADWNIYAYYQNTFAENEVDIQVVGIGATYNLKF
ncbi:hypothetical protein [Flavobacterium dankookense]|uniref:Outer membrane protein with beta-barrel domain n=1 Tax=Flavobacterium dankookense TaxID=706186 RepID=A0A4R6QE07_9FLAO|nr:hypothetical protein [Flavobacterium dankookense]TDP61094.1 hypothetical protein BC748_0704 [Flavobacterium dankookense]